MSMEDIKTLMEEAQIDVLTGCLVIVRTCWNEGQQTVIARMRDLLPQADGAAIIGSAWSFSITPAGRKAIEASK